MSKQNDAERAHATGRVRGPVTVMRSLFIPILLLMSACETVVDPATGAAATRWTLPGTAANAEAAQERWERCVQFRSESFCERNLPGGRPPGQAGLVPEMVARDTDP
jgi:hypothetical protein